MPRKESKFLKILLVIEDLLILFDDYVDKHDPGPFPEDFMTLGMRRNQYHFIKKDILDKNLNFKQRPQTLLKSIKKPWDENWSFILFDIPEKHSSTRNTLRRNIYKFGFRKLQRSVWFSPLPLETWTQKLDEEFNGLDYFTLVSGKIHQCNPQKIIKEKWQIKNWANRANDWIKKK